MYNQCLLNVYFRLVCALYPNNEHEGIHVVCSFWFRNSEILTNATWSILQGVLPRIKYGPARYWAILVVFWFLVFGVWASTTRNSRSHVWHSSSLNCFTDNYAYITAWSGDSQITWSGDSQMSDDVLVIWYPTFMYSFLLDLFCVYIIMLVYTS